MSGNKNLQGSLLNLLQMKDNDNLLSNNAAFKEQMEAYDLQNLRMMPSTNSILKVPSALQKNANSIFSEKPRSSSTKKKWNPNNYAQNK